MARKNDLTNTRFGRLVVLRRERSDKHRRILWRCLCDCGKESIVIGSHLKTGHTQSCGCLMKETNKIRLTTHGMTGTPEHIVWHSMIGRCKYTTDPNYKNYGGRGITVCKQWLRFENFFKDMGLKPKGLTLERKNNELGYFKENCSWDSHIEQSRNQRIKKNNTTGFTGIDLCHKRNKFRVRIRIPNKSIHIGYFNDINDAIIARMAAELKYWGKPYNVQTTTKSKTNQIVQIHAKKATERSINS